MLTPSRPRGGKFGDWNADSAKLIHQPCRATLGLKARESAMLLETRYTYITHHPSLIVLDLSWFSWLLQQKFQHFPANVKGVLQASTSSRPERLIGDQRRQRRHETGLDDPSTEPEGKRVSITDKSLVIPTAPASTRRTCPPSRLG